MAIAGLNLNLLELTQRQTDLESQISYLQSQKTLSLYSQQEKTSLQYAEKADARRFYKERFQSLDVDCEETKLYSYEQMPEYKEMIELIEAKYQDELAEISAWEANIDNQLTTTSAELEEVKAWQESYRTMLQSNIQDDFNFGLNQ